MATADTVTPPAGRGHPIGFWFFFWGEFAERCSYYGMRAILALYMIERLGVDEGNAGTYMSLFIAACYFFPLIGGYIADNYLGKYWTIVLFAIPYVVAQFMVGMENKYIVFGALVLLAMGSGVIKPNISTLMGMTYDQQRTGQNELRTSAFSWFYMAINIGAALSQFAMPWLQKKYDYQTAFLFPAGLMALALIIFALGKRFYAKETITQKIVGDPSVTSMPDGKTLTGIPIHYKVMSQADADADKQMKRMVLSRIGMLFLLVMFFWAIFDQAASTWIFFANTFMDTTIFGTSPIGREIAISGESLNNLVGMSSYGMPAAAFQGFNPVFIVLLVPLSVAFFKVVKVKATNKMAAGFVLTGLSMVIMSVAGYQAGTKEEVVKATFIEGELILPKFTVELDKVTTVTTDGQTKPDYNAKVPNGTTIAIDGPVKVTATDARWNTNNKKIEFTNGTLRLANGQTITVVKGRATTPLPVVKQTQTSTDTTYGLLESTLKPVEAVAEIEPNVKDLVSLAVVPWVKPQERITVWWQIFAYLILTIAEILISVTGLELAFVAAPQSMKSFVTACWLAVVFLANLLINAPITQLYPEMEPGDYFGMLAGAMLVSLFVFIPVAQKFNRAMEVSKAEDDAKEAGTKVV